jgi:hypothetical protein
MKRPSISFPRIAVLSGFVCGTAWWCGFRFVTGVVHEDALITYRYAQNLAAGNGFVFNAGERVLGTTTPLLTLLLAAIGRCFGPDAIPTASSVIMTCCGILAGIAVYRILAELNCSTTTRIVSIPLFFGNAEILASSVGGMETPLVLLCMTASALAFLRRRPIACLLACALLVLTRPDGVVWAGIMGIAVIVQARRIPWKAVFIASGLVLPWLVFAVWYFGSPLPHSVIAKQAVGPSIDLPSRLSAAGLVRFAEWYISCIGFDRRSFMVALWIVIVATGTIPYMAQAERRGLGTVLVLYPVLFGVFLYSGRAPQFWWYLVPVLLCTLLLAAAGISELSCAMASRFRKVNPRLNIGPAIAGILVTGACFVQNHGIVKFYLEFQGNETHTRRAVGTWLKNNTPPDSVVAMEAVGYQAFYSERAVIDLAGLVSPAVVALRKTESSNAGSFFETLSKLKPDYVVLRSFEVVENRHFHGGKLFDDEEQRRYFDRHYETCASFAAPYPERWGENSYLTIYRRFSSRPTP